MKLLHFADTHLGMENYWRVNPQTGLHSRFEDGLKCLSFIVDTALEHEVDAAIFAGDAYRTCDPNPTHQHGFATQMRRLRDASIPLVMVPGNHDMPVSFGRKSAIDIFGALGTQGVFVFTRRQIETVPTKAGPLQVAPFPWPVRSNLMAQDEFRGRVKKKSRTKSKARRRRHRGAGRVAGRHPARHPHRARHGRQSRDFGKRILRRHHARPAPPCRHAGQCARFDYVALGHVHKFQDLNKGAQPPVVYSGSMDRINFGEERDRKGCVLVDILQKGHASYEFIPTPTRPFTTIRCDIEAGEEPTLALLQAIDRKSEQLVGAVVRVVL